jgi:hypothetical protein
MTVSEFRRTAFVGKPPASATIRRMVERRDLPGEIRGKSVWIYVDESGNPVDCHQTPAAQAAAALMLKEWNNGRS